ncbi:hypothetical protein [Amycolatopsis samaneae]|uniref:Collagen adhesion protein n=1 Tax=Amycolatopsis samaneae TaxID=664691 RepID=A0ABW5GFT1_9PSEU
MTDPVSIELSGYANWKWEEALSVFADDGYYEKTPSRTTVTGVSWIKWDVWTDAVGRGNGRASGHGWNWYYEDIWARYWAVADANEEALKEPMTKFYQPMKRIMNAIANALGGGEFSVDGESNKAVQPWTFDRASTALSGAETFLTGHRKTLGDWKKNVGHKGDDFQGSGAAAFGSVLDGLIFRCDDVLGQLKTGSVSPSAALTDDPATGGTMEGKAGLTQAMRDLLAAYRSWMFSEGEVTYDTGLFGRISAPASRLAWPAGALQATWYSTAFCDDLKNCKPGYLSNAGQHFPKSGLLGADARSGQFWDGLQRIAQNLWLDHLKATLDTVSGTAISTLAKNYVATAKYLHNITPHQKLDFHPGGNGPKPPPGPGDGGDHNGKDGNGKDGNGKDGTGKDGPKPPPFSHDGTSKNDSNKKGPGGPGGPDGPKGPKAPDKLPDKNGSSNPGGPNPNGADPNALLKVPTGSTVGNDGVVRDANGKPVLDRLGRQIIVPPGSRVNHDGEIVGKDGKKLAEKDRVSRSGQDKRDTGDESELDRYLKSLRGESGGLAPPPLLLPNTNSSLPGLSYGGATVPSLDGLPALHSGQTDGKPSFATTGGGPQFPTAGGGPETPVPPKTVSGDSGPSLIKNEPGNGIPGNGNGGVPFYPPSAGAGAAGAGDKKGERDRTTWLAEDEETWGTDPKLAPAVLGARRRRARPAQRGGSGVRDHGQGGSDGRFAGGTTAPGYGHAEGTA